MIKIKTLLKKCTVYPHGENDIKYNIEIEANFIELDCNGKIKHIAGDSIGSEMDTYHCWEHEDIVIKEFKMD